MAKTRAQQNRSIRQEAVREKLSAMGLIQQIIVLADKLGKPDDLDNTMVSAMKASADIKLKLVDKYLPSLQSIESRVETVGSNSKEMTDDALADIATGSSARVVNEAESKKAVH